MGVPKGTVNNPKGRGNVPGKTTAKAREAIAKFVDDNAERLVGWLDQMAITNPEAAFKAYMSVVEYHIPRLARSIHVGEIDNPIEVHTTTSDRELIQRYLTPKRIENGTKEFERREQGSGEQKCGFDA